MFRRHASAPLGWGIGIACALVVVRADSALASGIEDVPTGTVGLGRAANHVRVNNFMATFQNPANLAVIPGNDLGFELRLPLLQACFDRARDNNVDYHMSNPDRGETGTESFAKVCNDGTPLPTGHGGWAHSFESGWGYGIGIFSPAAIANQRYGGDTILTVSPLPDETLPSTTSGVESPNRFLLLERSAIAAYLMAGAGVELLPQLRIGASAGVGFANIHNRSVASVMGGSFRDQEILIDLNVTDWLVPRALVSAVAAPVDGLDLMASFAYQDDIRGSGTAELDANGFVGAPLDDCRSQDAMGAPNPGNRCQVEDVRLHAKLPRFEAMAGIRYAARRSPRKRVSDPLADELWDVELNAYWSQTSHVDRFVIDLYEAVPEQLGPHIAFSSSPNTIPLALPPQANIARKWHDTFGVRLGGDINLVPSQLAVRLGASYETRGTPVATMNIDAWPVAKLGVHLGATLAIDSIRMHVAYAHVFYQPVDVTVGRGEVLEIASIGQDSALPVNEGRYEAALNVLSVGGSVTF
ncbi:MAG: hypothetical protein OXU20_13200 [Myxococcales bacterium]|nr:hypothetical protein [Myxococcales bacterium]